MYFIYAIFLLFIKSTWQVASGKTPRRKLSPLLFLSGSDSSLNFLCITTPLITFTFAECSSSRLLTPTILLSLSLSLSLLLFKLELFTELHIAMVLWRLPTWVTAFSHALFLIVCALSVSEAVGGKAERTPHSSLPFIWPLPAEFTFGNETLSVDPALSLSGNGASSAIVRAAFDRYRGIVFKHRDGSGFLRTLRTVYDVTKLKINVHSHSEEVGWYLLF